MGKSKNILYIILAILTLSLGIMVYFLFIKKKPYTCSTDNCHPPSVCVSNDCILNTFVVVGEKLGGGGNNIAWSDDGKNWTPIIGFNLRGTCIASNGNVWVAGGEENGDNPKNMIFSTDNARTWSPVIPPAPLPGVAQWSNQKINGLVWNGKNFIAVGSGFIGNTKAVWSDDGKTWESGTGVVTNYEEILGALACKEELCVAFGIKKAIYSTDGGKSWFPGSGDVFSTPCFFIAVNDDNNWVAISQHATDTNTNILISSDGKNWITPHNNIFTGNVAVNSVAHDNGKNWVVVSSNGIGYSINNGLTWANAIDAEDNSTITEFFYSVVYNGKIWVALNYNIIFYSSNGIHWNKNKNSNNGNFLCWNGIVFVITGSPIQWSDNATATWNKSTPDTLLDVTHGIACRYKV